MSRSNQEYRDEQHVVMVWFRVKPQHREDVIRLSIDYAERSVSEEPGCRRFDIVQDENDSTRFAYYKIYDSEDDFEAHKDTAHCEEAHTDEVKSWCVDARVCMCKPVFPCGDIQWDAARASAVESEAFQHGLYIYHGPLLVHPDRLKGFKEALRLEALGSVEQEPGCLRFDVHQTKENPCEFYLYEVFVNKEAFDYHSRTPHAQKRVATTADWYATGFSLANSPDIVTGPNLWPPDNWNWRHPIG